MRWDSTDSLGRVFVTPLAVRERADKVLSCAQLTGVQKVQTLAGKERHVVLPQWLMPNESVQADN